MTLNEQYKCLRLSQEFVFKNPTQSCTGFITFLSLTTRVENNEAVGTRIQNTRQFFMKRIQLEWRGRGPSVSLSDLISSITMPRPLIKPTPGQTVSTVNRSVVPRKPKYHKTNLDHRLYGLSPPYGILSNWKAQPFGDWIHFRLQVRGRRHLLCCVPKKELTSITGALFKEHNRVSPSPRLKMETDPFSGTMCFPITYNSGRRWKPINPVILIVTCIVSNLYILQESWANTFTVTLNQIQASLF
jgi:hypothetical protein